MKKNIKLLFKNVNVYKHFVYLLSMSEFLGNIIQPLQRCKLLICSVLPFLIARCAISQQIIVLPNNYAHVRIKERGGFYMPGSQQSEFF